MLSGFERPRRIVITGMGCVTPIGIGREAFWFGLQRGESGVRRIESFDVSNSSVKIAAEVRNFDWQAQLNVKDRKHVPRTVRLQEGGDEPARAMSLAMKDAGVGPSEIDYVNLHGTSTILNDRIETNTLKLALNCNSQRIPMSATKSQLGHPQGASGAAGLGAALCAIALVYSGHLVNAVAEKNAAQKNVDAAVLFAVSLIVAVSLIKAQLESGVIDCP